MDALDFMIEGHEGVVLSALMDGTDTLPLSAEDFSSPPNRTIFNCLSGLTNRNLLAVTDALRRSGELDKGGGAHRITEISGLPHDPAILDYALGEVLDASRARQTAKIGLQLHQGDISPDEAEGRLSKLNNARSGALPAIEDGAELIAREIALPADVIEGLVHCGGKMVLGGASKSYKTWTLIDAAVSVVTGTEWLGF